MINWNVVPMWWGESLPYTLFTEMEWIGKLSYITNDLNTRLTSAETTIGNLSDRMDGAEYQINVNKHDITELFGRVETLEGQLTETISVPAIPTPTDGGAPIDTSTTPTRKYSFDIGDISDVLFLGVSFDYVYDSGLFARGTYSQPVNVTFDSSGTTTAEIPLSLVYNAVSPNDLTAIYANAVKNDIGLDAIAKISISGTPDAATLDIEIERVYIASVSAGTGYFINANEYPEISNVALRFYK